MMKYKGYGFYSLVRLFFSKIVTLLLFNRCALIRLPIYIRNSNLIEWGSGLVTGVGCRFDAFEGTDKSKRRILIGRNVQINDYVHIGSVSSVSIGNNVLIASKVFISDHNHGSYSGLEHSSPEEPPALRPIVSNPVVIEDNVWIGEFVSVLPGVKIGAGSIIGANSVVTSDIPSNSIAVGVPARVIKKFDFKTSKWIVL